MQIGMRALAIGSAIAATTLAACSGGEPVGTSNDALAGAAFTTFDANQGGCLDSPNGINCNHYTSKRRVYLSGGPVKGSLDDGIYFFAILSPGNPTAALSDSASGNLSGAAGSPMSQRMFRISNGDIVPGSQFSGRGTGTTLNGRFILQAIPFADTPNPGGVYILAVCKKNATGPRDCKYDAFKVQEKVCPPKKDHDKGDKNHESGKDKYGHTTAYEPDDCEPDDHEPDDHEPDDDDCEPHDGDK